MFLGAAYCYAAAYVHCTVRDGTGQWNSAARTSVRATEDQPKSADDNDASGNTVDELSAHHVLNVGSEFISVHAVAFRQALVPHVFLDLRRLIDDYEVEVAEPPWWHVLLVRFPGYAERLVDGLNHYIFVRGDPLTVRLDKSADDM